MFVVIDGIDGSGKGTQVALLEKELVDLWKTVKIIDYPRYSHGAAFFIERYLNGDYWKSLLPKLASLFYALDRFDHSFELKRDLEEFDFVISNRYVTASMIHQAGKLSDLKEIDEYLDWLYDLEYNICGIPLPDKVIFLDVPPEVSAYLITQKQQREYIKDGSNKDIHEADENHLKNAYERAIYVSEKFQWTRVQCTQWTMMLPIDVITQMILKEILA